VCATHHVLTIAIKKLDIAKHVEMDIGVTIVKICVTTQGVNNAQLRMGFV
jgi:hypothetical protein